MRARYYVQPVTASQAVPDEDVVADVSFVHLSKWHQITPDATF